MSCLLRAWSPLIRRQSSVISVGTIGKAMPEIFTRQPSAGKICYLCLSNFLGISYGWGCPSLCQASLTFLKTNMSEVLVHIPTLMSLCVCVCTCVWDTQVYIGCKGKIFSVYTRPMDTGHPGAPCCVFFLSMCMCFWVFLHFCVLTVNNSNKFFPSHGA